MTQETDVSQEALEQGKGGKWGKSSQMNAHKGLGIGKTESALLEFIEKIENLVQFQDKIPSPSDINQIWDVFLGDFRTLLAVNVCALFLVDERSHEFVLKNVSPEGKRDLCQKELDYQIESGVFSWIIKRRKPAFIPSQVFKDEDTVILLPLSTTKRTLGVVLGLTPIKDSFVTREKMKLLGMLARQCALVMENRLLYENLREEHESLKNANEEIKAISVTDSLTGCYNRR